MNTMHSASVVAEGQISSTDGDGANVLVPAHAEFLTLISPAQRS